MRRLGLVVSDMHLGTGHRRGQINIYDDFKEDHRFAQLLRAKASSTDEVHLILNGDIFDLLKVPVMGRFPESIGERLAKIKLFRCLRGHPVFVKALATYLKNENAVLHFQPGNHDMEFFLPGVQQLFCRALTGQDEHPRVIFHATEPYFELDGVQFHHGHQFEALHAMDFTRLVLPRPNRESILNLPWGSLFVLNVVNELVGERPYLDKVHPFWPLFVGGMIVDTRFTTRMIASSVKALVQARFNPNWWKKRPFEKLSKFLRDEIGFFESLDHHADKILRASPRVRAVIMGHTHVPKLRGMGRDKVYLNTGTWIPMVDLNLGRLGQRLELHYGLIEWAECGPSVSLHRWHGAQPESEEVIA